jgi:MoaA/NifB/PqqE/SkfB family radical SAM enzyme
MIKYEDVRALHLELSSNCNARCPLCPRNFHGYPMNLGYPVTSLSLDNIKTMFDVSFVSRLRDIYLNGNFGDFMLASDALEIIKYFQTNNTKLKVFISTNGSARTKDFWHQLGATKNIEIHFCLDGLADTHHLYRIDTDWQRVIDNAKTYIAAGGCARWKMIKFDHNQHQIDACRQMSVDLGFAEFELVDHSRNQGTVYDRNGDYSHDIGTRDVGKYKTYHKELEDVIVNFPGPNYQEPVHEKIVCQIINEGSIYVSSNGDISPCCYLGMYSSTYGPATSWGNEQVKVLIADQKINALNHPLRECMEWFSKVEDSWAKTSYKDGRLLRCNSHCGVKEQPLINNSLTKNLVD